MATCRLELMGLPDTEAYRRLARGILRRGASLCSGLNVPNKKPGEPLLEWVAALRGELPSADLCVHYSLKHQRCRGDPAAAFERFCQEAVDAGAARVLLVTGPRGPPVDTVEVLERLAGRHPAPSRLRLGVAFNACLPSEAARVAECERLARKLRTGLVEDVWLNCGSEPALLAAGVSYARAAAEGLGLPVPAVFGSVLLPNPAQLQQMRERPWNGVHFSEEYLASLEGMGRVTGEVLEAFRLGSAEPIVESKVRNDEDLRRLEQLLRGRSDGARATSGSLQAAAASTYYGPVPAEGRTGHMVQRRRWGSGRGRG